MNEAEEKHEAECHCDLFSDCYKDVTGHRPRGEVARWSCARVKQWHDENYAWNEERQCYEPVVPFT